MHFKKKKIVIGSHESPLAKAQVDIFLRELKKNKYKDLVNQFETKFFKTTGDKFLSKKISEIGNKGLFTKEIDEAQLRSEIDIAVHSLKDLPTKLPSGLKVGAVLKREDPNDVIFSFKEKNIKFLKNGAVVGTSSIRRQVQLKEMRPDLIIKQIRGNLHTRISKLKDQKYDAIVLAVAGLKRLKITENYKKFNTNTIIPAPGQGVIALVIKKDKYLNEIMNKINHEDTFIESDCERRFLAALDGSCKTPIGALAKITKSNAKRLVFFRYMASSMDGKNFVKNHTFFKIDNYKNMSFNLGKKIKKLI